MDGRPRPPRARSEAIGGSGLDKLFPGASRQGRRAVFYWGAPTTSGGPPLGPPTIDTYQIWKSDAPGVDTRSVSA
jgi:hypothetical protein